MKHGEQAKLAKAIGFSPAYVSELLGGRRRASVRAAVLLEEVTGIERRAWLYPDEFANPMIEPKPEASSGNLSGATC